MATRKATYQKARACNPQRWSGNIRNWDLPSEIILNPAKGRQTKVCSEVVNMQQAA